MGQSEERLLGFLTSVSRKQAAHRVGLLPRTTRAHLMECPGGWGWWSLHWPRGQIVPQIGI